MKLTTKPQKHYQLQELTEKQEADTLSQLFITMEPWRTLKYSAQNLSNYLQKAELYKYSILADQKLVGVVCVRYPWLRGACLELLAIAPSQQGKGIGRDIIQLLETELSKTNYNNLWTLVSSFNHEAQHFYENMGFIKVGQLDDFIVEGYSEFLLRKSSLGLRQDTK